MRFFSAILGFHKIDSRRMTDMFLGYEIKIGFNFTRLNFITIFVYVVLGLIGLSLATINDSVTAFWPPTGFAVAMIILIGPKVLPGIFIGAIIVNYTTVPNILNATMIGVGNSLEAFVAYILFFYFKGDKGYLSFRNLHVLFFLCGFIATTVSAFIGSSSLVVFGLADQSEMFIIGIEWWLGDSISILILTPFIIAAHRHYKVVFDKGLLFSLMIISSILIFTVSFLLFDLSLAYIAIVPIIIVGFFFPVIGETTTIVLCSIIAIIAHSNRIGPFGDEILLSTQIFIAGLSIVSSLLFSGARLWNTYDRS